MCPDWNYLDDLEYSNEGSSGLQGRIEILEETCVGYSQSTKETVSGRSKR